MSDDVAMVLRARGKQAKAIGEAWEREWIADFREATGISMRRQLRENRQGNLGDIEIHERVPMVFQLRKRQRVSVWRALVHAEEVASPLKLYAVAVVQDRKGSAHGRSKNPRAIGMYRDDFDDMMETFEADPIWAPGLVIIDRKGKKYPRVWDGLEEAQRLVRIAAPVVIPICQGVREEGRPIVLIDYEGFLRIVGLLYSRKLW